MHIIGAVSSKSVEIDLSEEEAMAMIIHLTQSLAHAKKHVTKSFDTVCTYQDKIGAPTRPCSVVISVTRDAG